LTRRIKNVGTAAKEIADSTRDANFARQVVTNADSSQGSAIQLKILCAVKASTADDDTTAKNQLITCAQGLAAGLTRCVRAGEGALLKPK
jgi:hypothetical protein